MRCPECQKKLEQFAVSCPGCGWSLTAEIERAAVRNPSSLAQAQFPASKSSDFDLLFQTALNSLESEDAEAALKTVNRALQVSSPQQHWEAIAVRGYIHYRLGNFADSLQDCTAAIDAGWSDARTYAWRAAALAAEQRWPEAFDDLKEAIQLAGSARERYRQLQLSYLAEAEVFYLAELEKSPNNPALLRQLGWCYLHAGSAEKAHSVFQKCLQIDENESAAWLGKARLAIAGQEWPQAEFAASRAALANDSRINWQAESELARAQLLSGNRAAATATLKKLRRLSAERADLLLGLANLYQEFRNPAASLNILREMFSVAPDFLPGILSRASAYRQLQNHSLETSQYDHYLQLRPQSHEVLLARAQSHLALLDFDRAMEDATESLQMDVLETDAYLVRAAVFHARQDFVQGLNEIEHALKLDDRYPPAYFLRGKIGAAQGQFDRAIADFTHAIELLNAPSVELRSEYHYFRGTSHFERQQYHEAAVDFEQAIRLQPQQAGAWIWLAAAKSRLGQWTEAMPLLLKSQTAAPALARQYRLLGRSIATAAVEEFSRVLPAVEAESSQVDRRFRADGIRPREKHFDPLEVEPEIQAARVGRAMAFQVLGDADLAVRDYSWAIRGAPEDLDLWYRRGQVWQKLDEDRRAIRDFSHVIHRQQENHQARFLRAASAARLNEFDRALSDLIKSIRLAPNQTRYHLLRGELNSKRGKHVKAIRSFLRAESLDPDNPAIFRLRGTARWKRGQVQRAVADWSRSLELNSEQGDIYALRGRALLRMGDATAARSDFEQAIRLAPQNLMAVIGRADALVASGRLHSALLWLTKSLHRFPSTRGLADLLLARGRAYLAGGIWSRAITDASMALDLCREKPRIQIAARLVRARALLQLNQNTAASRDLKKVLRMQPQNPLAGSLLSWLQDPSQPRPDALSQPANPLKVTKPRVIRTPLNLNGSADSWNAEGPFDSWLLRDKAKQEFGPVTKETLNTWVEQGRVIEGMRVLRGDWTKWKKAEKVYPEIKPVD